MADRSKALADEAFRATFRKVLDGQPNFEVEPELPYFLCEKLERLDRAAAGKPKA